MQAFQITCRCCMSVLDFGVFRHDQLFKPVYSPACAASLLRFQLGMFKSFGRPKILQDSLWPPCNQQCNLSLFTQLSDPVTFYDKNSPGKHTNNVKPSAKTMKHPFITLYVYMIFSQSVHFPALLQRVCSLSVM